MYRRIVYTVYVLDLRLKRMWILSIDAFIYLLSWAPLESKIWLLQAFFGCRYGTLICWLVYQASLERGSLRTLGWDPQYDKSIWTSAMEYIIYTPGLLSSSSTSYLGRVIAGAMARATRMCHSLDVSRITMGIITAKKPLIALTSWELVN